MPAKDLGTKFVCFKCGTKFYDMRKPAPLCPKCGVDQRTNVPAKPAPAERKARAAKPVEPILDETDTAELDEELEADEADDDDDDDA
jgi:uncharacterized protein (TIGR02300 family)